MDTSEELRTGSLNPFHSGTSSVGELHRLKDAPALLSEGSPIRLQLGDASLRAVVLRIGPPDRDGEVALRLQVVDSGFAGERTESERLSSGTPSAEDEMVDYTAHPIRDLIHTLIQWSGPLPAWIRTGMRLSVQLAHIAWTRVPERHRLRVESIFRRVRDSRVTAVTLRALGELRHSARLAYERLG